MANGRFARVGEFAVSFQGEVNETNDREAGTISYSSDDGPEAIRGAHVCLYTLRSASQGRAVFVKTSQFLSGARPDSKALHHRHRRIGFQRKSPQNNFRRLIATPISAGTFLLESVSYIPEHLCSIPLELVLAVLNSNLAEWYFRLGSTNAMIGEYQVKNLPCPVFAGTASDEHRDILQGALESIRSNDLGTVLARFRPLIAAPPFTTVVRDLMVALVRRIILIEEARGPISRSARSALAPGAQPLQDLIDRLLYAMGGLTEDEARGVEERLSQML
jgi:hypothetical protein